MLPSIAFDRLWLNRWTTGAGDALTGDDIDAALTRRGPLRRPRPYHVYLAGLDIGLSKDASAFCIVAKHVGALRECEDDREPEPVPRNLPVAMQAAYDLGWWRESEEEREQRTYHDEVIRPTGRLRLVACHVWRPGHGRRVDLSTIGRCIAQAHERYGLATVNYDPHQAEMLAERLNRAGVPMERVPFSGANLQAMASAMLDAFTGRTIDLYPHDQLVSDLRALRIEEKSYGVRLTSPRGPNGHGDAATALSLACLAAQGVTETYEDRWIEGDLVFSAGRH